MKRVMCFGLIVVLLGIFPAELNAQTVTPSVGNAPVVAPPQSQTQRELSDARRLLAEQLLRQQRGSSSRSSNRARGGAAGSSSSSSYGAGGGSGYALFSKGSWTGGSSPHSANTLIVPAQGTGSEDIINAQDDLQVMSRLFQKQLEQAGMAPPRMNKSSFLFRDDMYSVDPYGNSGPVSTVHSMYLAGYGTVFQLGVGFPLAALPQDPNEQVDSEEDSVWAQTRQELLDPEAARRAMSKEKNPVPQYYDPDKVESLKKTLIKILRYARNIRALQADERVVVTVTSTAENIVSASGKTLGTPLYRVLIISADKADIDQFAGGDMSYEQFQQKVQIMMY